MNILIKIFGWLFVGVILYLIVNGLNKLGLVSNEALAGKETKKIRIAKYVLLGTILLGFVVLFIVLLLNS